MYDHIHEEEKDVIVRKTPAGLVMTPLLCAAVLWLAAACSSDEERSTGGCERGSSELVSRDNMSEEEHGRHLYWVGRANAMRDRHEDLLRRQPNFQDLSTGFLRDGKGGWTDTWGITVWVTEKVDQGALPPEDRIPDYLENVPVQVIDEELPEPGKNVCDYDRCGANSPEREGSMETTTEITDERIHEVRLKYDRLFWRQPNVFMVSEGFLADGRGGWTEDSGINVKVTRKVDQRALPPEDRIPDCLEGIPVKITEYSEDQIPRLNFDSAGDTHEEESNGRA